MSATHTLNREAEAVRRLLNEFETAIEGDDEIKETIIEGETNFNEAMNSALSRLAAIEGMHKGLDGAIADIKTRGARLDHQAERIRKAMVDAMEIANLKKFEGVATVSLKAVAPKVVIISEADLPSEYLTEKTTVTPDKKTLGEALKSGATIPGAELSNGGMTVSVRFK